MDMIPEIDRVYLTLQFKAHPLNHKWLACPEMTWTTRKIPLFILAATPNDFVIKKGMLNLYPSFFWLIIYYIEVECFDECYHFTSSSQLICYGGENLLDHALDTIKYEKNTSCTSLWIMLFRTTDGLRTWIHVVVCYLM